MSGLGTSGLSLAVDGMDNLYIADPSNGRVVKLSDVGASTTSNLGQVETALTSGFTAPSAVATDAAGNVYVIDGVNLFELVGGVGCSGHVAEQLERRDWPGRRSFRSGLYFLGERDHAYSLHKRCLESGW